MVPPAARPADAPATELYLVRHGLSVANRLDVIQGQSDHPLAPEGAAQAKRLASRLAGVRFDGVYASDLGRALETAGILVPSADITALPALREWDLGDWVGRKGETVRAEAPETWRGFRDPAHLDFRVPGGESRRELRRRVGGALRDIANRHAGGRVLVVSHQGALNAAFAELLDTCARVTCANASISVFRHDAGAWTLIRWNDIAHLEPIVGGGLDEAEALPNGF